MQSYLNNGSFREKIFRLRIKEETFNVSLKMSSIVYYLCLFFFQGYDYGKNLV